MMLSVLVLGLSGLSLAANPWMLQRDTAPTNEAQQCFDPTNQPINQDNYDCPAKSKNFVKLNSDGSCGKLDPNDGGNQCVQYCEVKLSWSFGPESPFDFSCQSGDHTCSITANQDTSVTNSYSFDVGFSLGKRDATSPLDRIVAGFNLGASWSWSKTNSSAIATTNSKPINAISECGYWTFVPYYVTSCGSLTYGDWEPEFDPIAVGYPGAPAIHYKPASCSNVKTVGNFCQTTPYVNSEGKTLGETVFVASDCDSHKQLAFCYQQKPYLQIGVSNNPDVFVDYLYAHTDDQIAARDISQPAQQNAVSDCFQDKWTGDFDEDPSWIKGGIGHAVAPMPSGAVAAGV